MSKAIKSLLEIASAPLASSINRVDSGPLIKQLIDAFLSKKNGFFAYEFALLVRPLASDKSPVGIAEWNDLKLWKDKYDADLSNHMFFAENIFGEQYSITQDGIYSFDPETGEAKYMAENLSDWASIILDKPNLHAGHSLAHAWQVEHKPLANGERLLPKQPFVLQGEFNIKNLVAKSDIDAMKIRAKLANEIASLPEGAQIKFEVIT